MTREAAHDWAEPLMFGQYVEPDMMVMTALQYGRVL